MACGKNRQMKRSRLAKSRFQDFQTDMDQNVPDRARKVGRWLFEIDEALYDLRNEAVVVCCIPASAGID